MNSDEHFLHLAEFVRGVELSGGTTPHVAMTVAAMKPLDDPLEKIWFAGCYAFVYNWPTAERIFLEWRPEDFEPAAFLAWLKENWVGLPLRKERKAVFRKPYFVESVQSYLTFARWLLAQDAWPATYADASAVFQQSCRYMGRYIGIRWLEVMRRAFGTSWEMPDIASSGGEHPRKALALLYPEDAAALLGGSRPAELRVSDLAADRCLLDLHLEYGIQTSYYELQSLLCEYKQSIIGRKQYPGKSIDTEMDYFNRVYAHWGPDRAMESSFHRIRAGCFPAWSLGELSGWNGVRPELGPLLATHGITWSDAVYDYPATTDFARPVVRGDGPGALL